MRSLRAVMVALGAATGSAVVASVLIVGCGGGTQALPGGGHDSGSDVTVMDAADTGSPDGDAGPAADADSGGDAITSGDAEGGSVGIPPSDWSTQEALAMCQGVLKCCPGGLDAGTYDLSSCVSVFQYEGWFEHTLPDRPDLYDAGNIAFNADAGTACLDALRNFPCGMQTAAQWQAISNVCFSVLEGTIPTGKGGCRSSYECAPNGFCDQTVDGGLCTPIVGQGQPCGTKAPRDEMCSYLGSDKPPLHCDYIDKPDAATCQPLLANGATCTDQAQQNFYDMACTAGLCGDNGQCGTPASVPYPFFCSVYQITDAGGGG